jgi:hypothetical protein
MKATLVFELPDESEEFHDACNGQVVMAALRDVAEAFRRQRKYDAQPVTEDLFFEIVKARGLEL